MDGFKGKWEKFKRYVTGNPVDGEKYDSPKVEDLPHMVDADGALVAVSSGKHDLSPVMSAKYNIKPGKSNVSTDRAIDDTIN